ncbi:MAG: glycoside hydrolase family 31 protein [Planctomycetota bacterium]
MEPDLVRRFNGGPVDMVDSTVLEQVGDCGARLRVSALSRGVLRFELVVDPSRPSNPSFALVETPRIREGWRAEGPASWRTQVHGWRVRLAHDRFQIDAEGFGLKVQGSWFRHAGGPGLRLERSPDERTFGLGQRAAHIERSGQTATLWNVDAYEYTVENDNLYQSCPFFIRMTSEGEAIGLFLDDPGRLEIDFGAADPSAIAIRGRGDALDLYVLPGPDPKSVLERFTELTGRMPMPPLWALGYHQSRYSYASEPEVRSIARELRRRRIPCDAIYFDIDSLEGLRSFHLCPVRFPEPDRLISDLRSIGIQSVVIVDPGIRADESEPVYRSGRDGDHFCRTADGEEYHGEVWPGTCAFPDFMRESTRRWFGEHYRTLIETGFAGFWNDMNEPAVFDRESKTFPDDVVHRGWSEDPAPHAELHNAYGHCMVQATYEGIERIRPDRRPFVLTRSAYAGTQRYAATWTGDSTSDWSHLRSSLRQVLSLGLSGQPFSGSDIGGFSKSPTPELFTRWIELGTLLPYCRTHSEKQTPRQEPWSYGEPFTEHNRLAIVRRYRLIPFFYTLVFEAHRTGAPIARPLVYEYPDDERTHALDDQFLLGRDLLCAPVLEPNATEREVYFPKGTWCHLERPEVVVGPVHRTVSAPLGCPAVFVRAGAIIPRASAVQHTGELAGARSEVLIVIQDAARGELYEDDGQSTGYRHDAFRHLSLRAQVDGPGQLQLSARKLDGDWCLSDQPVHVDVRRLDGEAVDRCKGEWLWSELPTGPRWKKP